MSTNKKNRGFSLVEVIVTIFVIGTMLVVSQAIRLGAPLAQSVRDQDIALKVAQNEVEELRALGYESLPPSGSFSDSLLASLSSGSGNVTVSDFNTGTKKVIVTVSWSERGAEESIVLSTLITKIGAL